MKHQWPAIHRALVAAGWTYRYSAGHHKYRPPPRRPDLPAQIVMPSTASDRRAQQNVRATLRRHGIEVP